MKDALYVLELNFYLLYMTIKGEIQTNGPKSVEGTKSDCSVRNQSLDVRSTTLLVRQYVRSHCTYAAMPETDTFDSKGDCYHTQNQE
jgi:hypothetical protein